MAKLKAYSWVGEGVHAIASRPIRLRYTMSPPISGRTHAIFRPDSRHFQGGFQGGFGPATKRVLI